MSKEIYLLSALCVGMFLIASFAVVDFYSEEDKSSYNNFEIIYEKPVPLAQKTGVIGETKKPVILAKRTGTYNKTEALNWDF